MHSKYKLATCHLFHPQLDGITNDSSYDIHNHFLVNDIINADDFYNHEYLVDIINFQLFYYTIIEENIYPKEHPTIRNYNKFLNNYKTYTLDIIQYDELEGGESVCYIKTFWLKIFQRKWKQYYSKLKARIQKMERPQNIRKREIQGK